MRDLRWGFEEGEEWDEVIPARSARDTVVGLSGHDPDGAVAVVVSPDGDVLEVRVDPEWRRFVDSRVLNRSVLAAANDATMRALAWQAEAGPPTAGRVAPAHDTPLTSGDIRRLLDAVAIELDRVTSRLPGIVGRTVSVTSAGRRVTAVSLRGQVVQVTIDANWAASARIAEIESELLDVLSRLRRESTTDDLTDTLRSGAIAELNALAGDPRTLLRRIGLLPRNEER